MTTTKKTAKIIKMKKTEKTKKTVSDFLRAIHVSEAIEECQEALKKIEEAVEKSRAKHEQLLYFKAETQKRLQVLRKEPGQ